MIRKDKGKKNNLSSTSVKCVWGLICSLSSLDQQKNNLSLFNVIDQFHFPKSIFHPNSDAKPVMVQHEVVMLWKRLISPDIDDKILALDMAVELVDPKGKRTQQIITRFEIEKGKRLNRFRVQTNALFITSPGDYSYEIGCKFPEQEAFEHAFSIPFQVCDDGIEFKKKS